MILEKYLDIFQNLMDSDTGNTYYSKTQVRLRESADKKVHTEYGKTQRALKSGNWEF